MKRGIVLLAVLALVVALPTRSSADTKEEYEERLRNEVTTVLDKYLGIGMSQVVVLVDGEPTLMLPPVTRVGEKPLPGKLGKKPEKRAKEDNSQMLWSDYSNRSRRSLMPGFSARQQMVVREDPKPQPQAPVTVESKKEKEEDDAATADMDPMILWKIKRILVSVVLDRSVDEAASQKVGAMVMDMLGLDPERGDKLNVYKLPFKSPWNLLLTSPMSWLGSFKWALIALLVGALAWGTYKFGRKALNFILRRKELKVDVNTGEETPEGEEGAEGEEKKDDDAEGLPLTVLPEVAATLVNAAAIHKNGNGNGSAAAKAGALARLKAFQYVSQNNAQLLGEVISKDDDIQLAVLTSFLDPALGSTVLKQLDEQKRRRVLLIMSNASHVPPEALKKIEQEVELRLQYAVGGTEAVSDLISQMDPKEQNEMIKALWQKDQLLATKLFQMIFRFEDLFQLPERELRALAEAIPMPDWVSALGSSNVPFAQALGRVLPDETRAVFQQYVEMGGKTASADMQWKILKVAKELKAQGRIQLRKPQTSAPASTPAPVVGKKEGR